MASTSRPLRTHEAWTACNVCHAPPRQRSQQRLRHWRGAMSSAAIKRQAQSLLITS